MIIDFTKPLQTRSGRPVRLLEGIPRGPGIPMPGAFETIHGEWVAVAWGHDGTARTHDGERRAWLDLVNVPVTGEKWVNVYPSGDAVLYRTRDAADRNASSARIARIRVEYTEGQFDE